MVSSYLCSLSVEEQFTFTTMHDKMNLFQMYTPLHAAASSGQMTVVKFLLEYQVEVDAVNVHGNTALHIACLNGQDPVVTELLQFGASINSVNNRGMVSNHNLYNTFICNSIVNQVFPIDVLMLFSDINNTHLFFPIYMYIRNDMQVSQFSTKYLYVGKYSFVCLLCEIEFIVNVYISCLLRKVMKFDLKFKSKLCDLLKIKC